MERFIVVIYDFCNLSDSNLKSSMERFIVVTIAGTLVTTFTFKIQYGEIYRYNFV